jgi:hypothetical protein
MASQIPVFLPAGSQTYEKITPGVGGWDPSPRISPQRENQVDVTRLTLLAAVASLSTMDRKKRLLLSLLAICVVVSGLAALVEILRSDSPPKHERRLEGLRYVTVDVKKLSARQTGMKFPHPTSPPWLHGNSLSAAEAVYRIEH